VQELALVSQVRTHASTLERRLPSSPAAPGSAVISAAARSLSQASPARVLTATRCGCQVSSPTRSSSVVYSTVLPCGSRKRLNVFVARQVAARAPDLLRARAQQASGAAHVLVDPAQAGSWALSLFCVS
jgi:hypothetical protein